ncbi:type II toxin-antitoxin system RelE/ParE family toxin [Granulicella sibirica]|uniref:type II toxin-antitoxin system RelE family toxin n=1 Tax=Granulicella sibirica TaxID=2479048 RepID=UPI0010088091
MPLQVEYHKSAEKYLEKLDQPLQNRIKKKIEEIAAEPDNPRLSLPLAATTKRGSRVGKYRILLLVKEPLLYVVEVDSRGQIYRTL